MGEIITSTSAVIVSYSSSYKSHLLVKAMAKLGEIC